MESTNIELNREVDKQMKKDKITRYVSNENRKADNNDISTIISDAKERSISVTSLASNTSKTVPLQELEVSTTDRSITPWMIKPKDLKLSANQQIPDGLEFLNIIRKLYIYKNIQIFDKMFDRNTTQNCFTVRNADFQKVYYIGTAYNRKPGKILGFSLRVIDQYNRNVISIKKHLCLCFGRQTIDIECPSGQIVGKMIKMNRFRKNLKFCIFDSQKMDKIKFFIKRNKNDRLTNDFNVLMSSNQLIAVIAKRFERVLAPDKTVLYKDYYTKVILTKDFEVDVMDKALILSAALIMVLVLII